MRWSPILLLCTAVYGQVQGNRPQSIDGYISQNGLDANFQITAPDNVNSGELLVVGAAIEDTAGGSPFTVTDTLGNTWNQTSTIDTGKDFLALYYVCSAFSGANKVSINFPLGFNYSMTYARYKNISCTTDGSVQTATASGHPATMSTTSTTTTNGDLLITVAEGNNGGGALTPTANSSLEAYNNEQRPELLVSTMAQLAGSYSVTVNNVNNHSGGTGPSSNAGIITIAFKPAAIKVVTTQLPDCAVGISCSMQLQSVGGTAALTFACTGLPSNGMSLNTSTGVISGATPTLGTLSLGCTVTDGTVTSVTDNLTLKIGAGFNTPTVVQSILPPDGTGVAFPSMRCGSIEVLIAHGIDIDGGSGYILNDNGANNHVKDSFGNVLHRITLGAGNVTGPTAIYVSDPITQSGPSTVSIIKNTGGSMVTLLGAEISGVQTPIDAAGYIFNSVYASTNPGGSSPISAAASYTTIVPNEMVLAATGTAIYGDTFGYAAPFSPLVSGSIVCCIEGSLALANATITSAGSTTATVSVTTSAPTSNSIAVAMLGLRPALPTACTTKGLGERFRRTGI